MARPGYLKLWRSIIDKPIWKQSTPEQKTILITLLIMADFNKNDWEFEGKQYKTMPGQFVTSLPSIVAECGKGITIQNVRTALKRFEKLGFLTDKSTKVNRLITIVNWEVYQSSDSTPNSQTNSDLTDDQQTPNSQLTSNEEVKKLRSKEVKNNNATNVASEREEQLLKEFNDWWSLYNKKKDKKVALSKFKIARKQHSLETIVKGTKSYLKTVTNKQYQKHPKTFLNNETFLDEFDEHEITQTNKTDSHSSFDVTDYLADME